VKSLTSRNQLYNSAVIENLTANRLTNISIVFSTNFYEFQKITAFSMYINYSNV